MRREKGDEKGRRIQEIRVIPELCRYFSLNEKDDVCKPSFLGLKKHRLATCQSFNRHVEAARRRMACGCPSL